MYSLVVAVLTRKTGGALIDGTQYSTTWSALVLLSMILFVASYATGLGNVPWQQGELFSLEGVFSSLIVMPFSMLLTRFVHSTWHWYIARNSHQLGWKPAYWLDLPLSYGKNYTSRCFWVLCWPVSSGVSLRPDLFPRNRRIKLGGSQAYIQRWIWDQKEPGVAKKKAGNPRTREGQENDMTRSTCAPS